MTDRKDEMITTTAGASLTGYTRQYIRALARIGGLPAKKIGRDWVISQTALLAHKAKMDAWGTEKHNPWRE
jgi:excisionase family DNA binding protein